MYLLSSRLVLRAEPRPRVRVRTRRDAPECASIDARHSFQATIVRWRHTFFSTATDALIASASSMVATCLRWHMVATEAFSNMSHG